MKGYVVLGHYDSSSSGAVYDVRRGGDGVLYCTCRGWVASLNAQKRGRTGAPAECRHTKDYVARHPGTSYGPAWALKISKVAPAPTGKKQVAAPKVAPAAAPAPSNWRETLLREQAAAEARGMRTPAEAAAAFLREVGSFDLDEITAAPAAAAAVAELDIE